MDVDEIVNTLADFSNLEAELLMEEIDSCSQEIDKLKNETQLKRMILQALNEEISSLPTKIDQLKEESESLDVELIRVKTQKKKFEKNIGKLKSLNASNIKIEVSENDKIKLAKNKTKLELSKNLLRIFINSDDKGFTLNPVDWQLKLLQLNKSNSKQVNREILWKSMNQSSRYNQEWQELFD